MGFYFTSRPIYKDSFWGFLVNFKFQIFICIFKWLAPMHLFQVYVTFYLHCIHWVPEDISCLLIDWKSFLSWHNINNKISWFRSWGSTVVIQFAEFWRENRRRLVTSNWTIWVYLWTATTCFSWSKPGHRVGALNLPTNQMLCADLHRDNFLSKFLVNLFNNSVFI